MARPLEPNPILEDSDAEMLLAEAESPIAISIKKRSELEFCASLFRKYQPAQ